MKQIICEELTILQFLKDGLQKPEISDTLLKVIANLCVDNKVFIDQLTTLKRLSLAHNTTALFCIKNLGFNLDEQQAKKFYNLIDFSFIREVSLHEQGMLILR